MINYTLLPLLLLLAGCAAQHGVPRQVPAEGAIQLRIGDSVSVAGLYRVRFDTVTQDSRCPPDVKCIWEGYADVLLTITTPFGEVVRSSFPTNGFGLSLVRDSIRLGAVAIHGNVLILNHLDPAYPPKPPKEYSVTLHTVALGSGWPEICYVVAAVPIGTPFQLGVGYGAIVGERYFLRLDSLVSDRQLPNPLVALTYCSKTLPPVSFTLNLGNMVNVGNQGGRDTTIEGHHIQLSGSRLENPPERPIGFRVWIETSD